MRLGAIRSCCCGGAAGGGGVPDGEGAVRLGGEGEAVVAGQGAGGPKRGMVK